MLYSRLSWFDLIWLKREILEIKRPFHRINSINLLTKSDFTIYIFGFRIVIFTGLFWGGARRNSLFCVTHLTSEKCYAIWHFHTLFIFIHNLLGEVGLSFSMTGSKKKNGTKENARCQSLIICKFDKSDKNIYFHEKRRRRSYRRENYRGKEQKQVNTDYKKNSRNLMRFLLFSNNTNIYTTHKNFGEFTSVDLCDSCCFV